MQCRRGPAGQDGERDGPDPSLPHGAIYPHAGLQTKRPEHLDESKYRPDHGRGEIIYFRGKACGIEKQGHSQIKESPTAWRRIQGEKMKIGAFEVQDPLPELKEPHVLA